MEKHNFWNDAARGGAIIGAVLALSAILETSMTLSGKMTMYMLIVFEWLGFAALHYYLLHRFTRTRSQLYSQEEGFPFGQGYGFLLVVSGFAGILLGLVQYLYLHVVVGYSTYVETLTTNVSSMLSFSGIPASMQGMYAQILGQLQNQPEPSLLSTVWSGFFTSLLFGGLFGLIIAGVLSRAPRPFGTEENHE